MPKSLTKQRKRFWHQDPRCHWCGIETILTTTAHIKGTIAPEDRDRIATIDHLHPRHHPDRLKPNDLTIRHVLSCWKCNNDRDTRERAALDKSWFYERGCSKPLSMRPTEELERSLGILRAKKPKGRKNRESVDKSIADIEAELATRNQ